MGDFASFSWKPLSKAIQYTSHAYTYSVTLVISAHINQMYIFRSTVSRIILQLGNFSVNLELNFFCADLFLKTGVCLMQKFTKSCSNKYYNKNL